MIEMASCLEFEKPIYELEQKLIQLEEFGQTQGVDVDQGLAELRKRIDLARQELSESLSPWQRVQLARHSDRPYPRDYIQRICTDFMEFHGDRRFADDEAIVGGFAKFDGESVMVIGTQKGRDLKENVRYNFGSARPEGYRKALRLMKMADLARVPILLMIDTPGAYPGVGAEERHIGEAIAVNLREMFKLNVPVVAVVVGEGGSGGALGIGVGNRVLIMKNAYYSVITPEGCAAILWHDGAKTPQAAAALKLTSADLLRMGLVDEVIEEPLGGAHRDYDQAALMLAEVVRRNLQELKGMPKEELWQQRYEKFRKMGVFQEV
jgi:acetyl-CoA carboxylase carboxyl transferase subunit alpha